jgi:hypothetical protein
MLDEFHMKYRSLLLILCIGAVAIGAGCCAAEPSEPPFDASRLKTGTFVYRDIRDYQEVGQSEISVRKRPSTEDFVFSNVVTGEFSQRWTAISTANFHPIFANLSFGDGSPVFELNYTADRVTGFLVKHKGPDAGSKRSVDDQVPADIVDQRIDWAAVSASDLDAGREFEFEVYDPGLGVSHVIIRVGAAQSLAVPAGRFQVYAATYEIKKRTGAEKYQVFVTVEKPRMLIREEFPDGTVSDLVSAEQR